MAVIIIRVPAALPETGPVQPGLADGEAASTSRSDLVILPLLAGGITLLGYGFIFTLSFWKKNTDLVSLPRTRKLSYLPAD